ncbi:hypothetical protein Tco_0805192 [Tanacetum coccineum]
MTGVPIRIIKHALNANSSVTPVSQKSRVFSLEKSQVVKHEVAEWLKAGIVKPVRYPTWISNPVLVKKVDGSSRMCIDFKNIISACPKDYYPLPEIDLKIESVMGFPLKFFLDAYKGYHQVQITEEDEEKTSFYTDQAEKSLPFFKTLKDITKENKGDYQLSEDTEISFQELKKMILNLLTLTTPLPKETLYIYLVASQEAILCKAETSGKLAKYSIELGAYDIMYEPHSVIKGQGIQHQWVRGRSGSYQPHEDRVHLCLAAQLSSSVNADSKLVANQINGNYESYTGRPLQANYVIREIHMEACSMQLKARLVVEKAIRQGYYWSTMHRDAREEIRKFDSYQIHSSVPKLPKTLMTLIMAPWTFFQWGIDVLGSLLEALDKVKFTIVAIDYFTK